ncbi:MAG: winged helix-turn-helix domain-containing protein [Acidobacteriaceae bacterium]|nr:winged helix-turn-helix domain-containing protein [Acidobacteriaceae bacterium]
MGACVAPRVRFGAFEVDLRSGEIFRYGSKLKLQNQPFQVLAVLLEHPGELVTREELRNRLWPKDTFVDFDCGLNKAINGLRSVLRDRAKRPRFIETLPHRGYRFIASLEPLGADAVKGTPVLSRALAFTGRIDSIAVLLLDNYSGDPGQEYFCEGMTEELISALSKISSLRVISRTSVARYRGARKSIPEIARELRVDAVVEGSVMRCDQKVRITAQVIGALDDRHIWSGRYERELRDILQLQAEIADSIAGEIHKLVDPELRPAMRMRQVHPQAYEACLKGNYFRDKATPADLQKSTEFFLQAISLDPAYAQAYADLSESYFYLGLFGVAPCSEAFTKARANALRALQLDETVVAAHNALAAIHILDWDWAAAEAACSRAAKLNPGDARTRAHFADYMSIRGRHDEAIEEYRRALELDPISRVRLGHFGLILYRARRYEESICQCLNALEIDPTYANALWFLALALEQKGRLTESVAKLEKAVSQSEGLHYRALLGRAYALAGDRARAENTLYELKRVSQSKCVSPLDIAVVYHGLGDLTSTFEWLEEAYRQRVFRLIELTLPMFDSLRFDPRWQELVRRIGLSES